MNTKNFFSTFLWLIILLLIYCAILGAVSESFMILGRNNRENARQVVTTLKDVLSDDVVKDFLQHNTFIASRKTDVLLFIVSVKLMMGLLLVSMHIFGILAIWKGNDTLCIIYTVVLSSTVWIDMLHHQLNKLNVLITLLLIIYLVVVFYFDYSEVKEEDEDNETLVKVNEENVNPGPSEVISEIESVDKL